MKRDKKRNKGGKWEISFAPITRYSAVFCALFMGIAFMGGCVLSAGRLRSETEAALTASHGQISQKVAGAVDLLESLASLPEYYDPDIPPIDKVKKLDQISPYFGYMMICYVDSDITVYSDGAEPASLASRDYMQQLFSTGRRQVTDSFAAGADGVTLNYTVAVPLMDQKGQGL